MNAYTKPDGAILDFSPAELVGRPTDVSEDVCNQQKYDELPLTVIEARPSWSLNEVREFWHFRELLFSLTWRDVKVRYKQSVLGVAWAIIQPLTMMIVFTMFFGNAGKLSSGDYPYPIFVLAGLLPWFFFSTAVSTSSQSIVGNHNLITKVYFPRLMVPISAVIAGLVDFAIAMSLLACMMVIYQIPLGLGVLVVPILVLALFAAALGVGVLFAALAVKYRDVKHIIPFMVQLWMFVTPTIYMHGNDSLDSGMLSILPFNPAYGLILNFRIAVLGGEFDYYSLGISAGMSFLLLALGCWYFRRVERGFADFI
jgi:lipopolysaccharide transport system permease protein